MAEWCGDDVCNSVVLLKGLCPLVSYCERLGHCIVDNKGLLDLAQRRNLAATRAVTVMSVNHTNISFLVTYKNWTLRGLNP